MWVLGISRSHNGAVALTHNGKIYSAIQAERISRIKRQPIFLKEDKALVSECVEYCLNQAGIRHADIQSIAISTPWGFNHMENNWLFDYMGGAPMIIGEHIMFPIIFPIWNTYYIIPI